jgi:hypothetical protein
VLRSREALHEQRSRLGNSSYCHECVNYCLRPLPKKRKRDDNDGDDSKPHYVCRFGKCKKNKKKEVVWTAPAHDEPRFIQMRGGRLAYEAPTDDWRVMPKPLVAQASELSGERSELRRRNSCA